MTKSQRSRSPTSEQWAPVLWPIDDLLLDPKNPRLRDVGLDEGATQPEIIKALWKSMAVDEIALSIAENGFYQHEPLFAVNEGGKLFVIEGNRRLAAVKLLRDPKLSQAVGASGLPTITTAARDKLSTLPVITCEREDVWAFLGFKHINGPQAWDPYSKAHYVAWVHNTLKIPLAEIANRIGDKHSTVERHYDALMVLEQAEDASVFDREDRHKKHFSFSHLFTGLRYSGIREFLGLPLHEKTIGKQRPVPKKHERELGELLTWLYGSHSKRIEPLIQSQNPDLRQLDEILASENGTIALRKGLPLRVSLDISKGDERVFRESLVTAKQSLQKARGTVLTGYNGNLDLLTMARDISELAGVLVAEMDAEEPAATPRKKRPRK